MENTFGNSAMINHLIPYAESRIDCFSVNQYFKNELNEIIIHRIFNPTIYADLNQMKGKIMSLKDKLNASKNVNPITANANNQLQKSSLAAKLASKDSVISEASMTAEKFAQVEALRQEIKNLQLDTVNMQSDIEALTKVIMECNQFTASTAKDIKSTLNAVNSLHGNFAKILPTMAIVDSNPDTIINRKQHSKLTAKTSEFKSVIEGLEQGEVQALYELFKSQFNHKFAKSSKADKLSEFSFFINGIDFTSLDTIDATTRAQWQAFKNANNNQMIFAPNSMKLAVKSLIAIGNDLDLIADNSVSDSKVNTEVKDFAYWSSQYGIADKSIISEVVDLVKQEGLNNKTSSLIAEYLNENSVNDLSGVNHGDFFTYLKTSKFA